MSDSAFFADASEADAQIAGQLRLWGGVAAAVGGALRILSTFIPYVADSPPLELLYAVIDLSLLFGLGSICLSAAPRIGRLGLIGAVVAFSALASLVGPDASMSGIDFYLAGSAAFEAGLLILSISLLFHRQLTVAASLWIVSALMTIGVACGLGWLALTGAGATLGLGFLTAGLTQVRVQLRNAETPGRSMVFNQVTIGCNDLSDSIAFYRQLGFRLIVNSLDNQYARFEAPNGTTLSLHKGLPTPAGAVLYFEHSKLDESCACLARMGVPFDHPPRDERWGWREARLRDPAGNPLCLYHAGAKRRFPPWRLPD